MQNVKDLDIVEIAKLVRLDLKAAIKTDPRLDGVKKFSVTTSRYSQGQSLSVTVMRSDKNPYNVKYKAKCEAIENTSWSDFAWYHVNMQDRDAVRERIKSLQVEEMYTEHRDNVYAAVQDVILRYQEIQGEPGDRWYSFYEHVRFASSFEDEAMEEAKILAQTLCLKALDAVQAERAKEEAEYEQEMEASATKQKLEDEQREVVFEGWTAQDEQGYQAELERIEKQNESTPHNASKFDQVINSPVDDNLIQFPAAKSLSGQEVAQNLDNAIAEAEKEIEKAELALSNLKKALKLKALRAHAASLALSIENHQKMLSL